MKLLEGKAVVITGAGRGIGAACAKGAAQRGAAVVVNDIDAEPAYETVDAIKAAGGNALACVADVSKWEDSGRLIQSCLEAFGKIDGLVNNAGLFHTLPIDAFDPEAARALIDTNVMGPLYCTSHAVKPMLARKAGSIVNVTSGAQMGMANMGVYGASKGAVASMVYTWALELAGTGVRVNGLSPLAATRMGALSDDVPESVKALIPPPENNSPVVEYLLSDLSSHVNGQIIRKDRDEVCLCTHPAVLLPTVARPEWSAEGLAEVFDHDFHDRLIACGVMGIESLPVEPKSGFWQQAGSSEAATS